MQKNAPGAVRGLPWVYFSVSRKVPALHQCGCWLVLQAWQFRLHHNSWIVYGATEEVRQKVAISCHPAGDAEGCSDGAMWRGAVFSRQNTPRWVTGQSVPAQIPATWRFCFQSLRDSHHLELMPPPPHTHQCHMTHPSHKIKGQMPRWNRTVTAQRHGHGLPLRRHGGG